MFYQCLQKYLLEGCTLSRYNAKNEVSSRHFHVKAAFDLLLKIYNEGFHELTKTAKNFQNCQWLHEA